ncbi:MAG: aminotransferase class I/II-fold pyridoxal phosphate-dependent enzyme [Thaumarchaeota archaeon]|nr:aminotransferase class I/II-fold pyridoxal phosphate-dependent enzyme [Nitrososphaerota archaeon]
MKADLGRRRVSKKIDFFVESVIRQMTRLANQYEAINLAQGMPDFAAPARIKNSAVEAIQDDYNQYEITWGSVALREGIAKKAGEFNGIEANPQTDVTVTCGSTEAMTGSIVALTDPGDEVIIPEPFYENYVPATLISGATPKHVRLKGEVFGFDEEELKACFNSHTKAIVINTPNNPAGKVFTKQELSVVADLCEDYDAIGITDEIYEYIVYDGLKHVSLATIGGMADRTVTISGLSKTFSVTGWRIGYAIAAKEMTDAIRKVHDFTTVCAPAPLQRAAVEAMKMPDSYYTKLAGNYQKKRDFTLRALSEVGFRCVTPEGAYYILADFSELSPQDDTRFAQDLVKEAGVAVVPGSSFYSQHDPVLSKVRFTFSKKEQTLKKAAARLRKKFNF